MHEVSIIQNVISIVCEKAQENNLIKVKKISLKIGQLSGVAEDSLNFAFGVVSKDTITEGAELIIEKVQASAHCVDCDISFNIHHFNKCCPKCKKFCSNITSGYELYINTIEGD